jgi:NADH-quinone oxidoreductase subunit G
MPNITIDGITAEVDGSLTVIQAARQMGIDIPHFCWHPKLSVSGNCRMCLVEVEKMPKLVISCATPVAEGMIVRTASEKVLKARQSVMEFLLINHPLDCPICDEAGECKLQDYAYSHSVGVSRFEENKVHKPKRVELGPHVLLDTERCIMCSRCIRFCDEIAKKPQLTFVQRGDHVELTTYPGQPLDNPYSMNVIDLCPVGALTSREFRFKARVWEMSSTETVCPGCSRGCNMNTWVRNNEVLRQTPRFNADVNSYWMCDHGRLETFARVNDARRIKSPLTKRESGLAEAGWDEAIARVASELKSFRKGEVAVIGSAYATNEDNYVLRRFALDVLGTRHLDFQRHVKGADDENLLIRADKTPNALGAHEVGVRPPEGGLDFAGIIKAIREGGIKAAYVMDDTIAQDPEIAQALGRLDFLVVHACVETELTRLADVVFPAATYAEKNGTYTNFQGRVQRIRPAVALLDADRAMDGFAASRLDKFGSQFDRWNRGAKRDARPSWRIVAGVASLMGGRFRYQSAEDVFTELASGIDAFKGMSYRKLGTKGMMLPSAVRAGVPVAP